MFWSCTTTHNAVMENVHTNQARRDELGEGIQTSKYVASGVVAFDIRARTVKWTAHLDLSTDTTARARCVCVRLCARVCERACVRACACHCVLACMQSTLACIRAVWRRARVLPGACVHVRVPRTHTHMAHTAHTAHTHTHTHTRTRTTRSATARWHSRRRRSQT